MIRDHAWHRDIFWSSATPAKVDRPLPDDFPFANEVEAVVKVDRWVAV